MIIDTNELDNMRPVLSEAQAPSHKNTIFKAPTDFSSQPFSHDECRDAPITATISFYSYSHEEDDDIIFHEDIEVCECLCNEAKPKPKHVKDDQPEFEIERILANRHELPYILSSDHKKASLSQVENFHRRSILLAMEEEEEREETLASTTYEGLASNYCENCRKHEDQYNFKTFDTFQPLKNAMDEVVAAFSSRAINNYDSSTDNDGVTI